MDREILKDVRANCLCASLLRLQFMSQRHATSCTRKMAKCRFWLTFVPRSIQHKSQQIPTFSNQLKITTTHLRPPRHNPHFSTFQIFFLLKPTEKTVIFFYKFFLFTAFHSPLYTCLQKIVTFLYLLRSV